LSAWRKHATQTLLKSQASLIEDAIQALGQHAAAVLQDRQGRATAYLMRNS
jgi:hypothetical protein